MYTQVLYIWNWRALGPDFQKCLAFIEVLHQGHISKTLSISETHIFCFLTVSAEHGKNLAGMGSDR